MQLSVQILSQLRRFGNATKPVNMNSYHPQLSISNDYNYSYRFFLPSHKQYRLTITCTLPIKYAVEANDGKNIETANINKILYCIRCLRLIDLEQLSKGSSNIDRIA